MQKLCAVILAAGASSRMGREKALLPWPPGSEDSSLLSAAIFALKPFADAVIVVTGSNAERLAPLIDGAGAVMARNLAPERGQFSSMQTGLQAAVERGYEAAMITPVDCPPLSAASLEKLCAAFEQARVRGIWAVAPEHNGRQGHPLVAGRELMGALLSAPVSSNAREVRQAHEGKLEHVAVAEPLLSVDVNTPEQYSALAEGRGE